MRNPVKFRAYADDAECFWVDVRVFGTAAQMRADIKRCVGDVDKRTAGQVSEARFYTNKKLTGVFAVMWLNRKDICDRPSEITAHESVHAAMRYFERRGWPVCLHSEGQYGAPNVHERRLEERFAHAVGRISKHLTRGFFRHGVWK